MTTVAEAVRLDEVHALARLRPADDRQRHVTFGAQLGDRLDEVAEALEGDVGGCRRDQPAGDSGDLRQRPEQLGIDADRHEAHAVEADPHVGVDVVDRVLADDDDPRHPRGDAALHVDERVPAADRPPLAPARRLVHLQHAIAGDRVVQGDDGRDLLLEEEDAVAEALVVVDEIEVAERVA